MLSEPQIVTRPDQPFAAIRISLDRSEIPTRAPPLIGEVAGWLGSKGVAPVGAPFFNYLERPEDGPMVMEVGFPTASQLSGNGRVRTGAIPGGRFATVVHTGPYRIYRRPVGKHKTTLPGIGMCMITHCNRRGAAGNIIFTHCK